MNDKSTISSKIQKKCCEKSVGLEELPFRGRGQKQGLKKIALF